jgi:hypothetical protein
MRQLQSRPANLGQTAVSGTLDVARRFAQKTGRRCNSKYFGFDTRSRNFANNEEIDLQVQELATASSTILR